MKIAFIGHGQVGGALANHLQQCGHQVTIATDNRQSESVQKILAKNPQLQVAAPLDAVTQADVVFLATPYNANAQIIPPLAAALAGKIIVDCTNPVGAGLSHGLQSVQSGSEALQALAPQAHVVKAFTIYGFENFENNAYPAYNVKPLMMYCGNDTAAKNTVSGLIEQLGWQALDVGGLNQALHLEHMTLLWVRMVRMNGASPNMVWGMLRR